MKMGDDQGRAANGAAGRSTLLRAGRSSVGRRRAWLARYAGVAVMAAGLGFGSAAIGGVWFATDGPWRAVYLLHDHVWLPFYGWAWTAIFPDGLIWLTVAIGLCAVIVVEYLGLASGVRAPQASLLRFMIRRAPDPLVAWHKALGVPGLRAGLAEAVLREMRDADLHSLTRDREPDPSGRRFRRLARLQRLQIRMGLAGSHDLVAIVDILSLAALDSERRRDAGERLAKVAMRLSPETIPDWERFARVPPFPASLLETLDSASLLTDPDVTSEALACRSVGVALAIAGDGRPERMIWFDAWARLRASGDARTAGRLALAESLCAFEFWADLAERGLQPRRPSAFMAAAFDRVRPVRSRGEIFAAGGAAEAGGLP